MGSLQEKEIHLPEVDIQDLDEGSLLAWAFVPHLVEGIVHSAEDILVQVCTVGLVLVVVDILVLVPGTALMLGMGQKHLLQMDLQDILAWNQEGKLLEEQRIQKEDKTFLKLALNFSLLQLVAL